MRLKIKVIHSNPDEGQGSVEHLIGQEFEISENYEPLGDGTVYIETPEGLYPLEPNEYDLAD